LARNLLVFFVEDIKEANMVRGLLRISLYALIVILPLALALLGGRSGGPFIWNLARGCALAAFAILALQAVLAARFQWINGPFGYDIVIRFHRNMALFAGGLLLLHPVLLILGGAGLSLLYGGGLFVWLGEIALALVVFNLLVSVYQTRLKLKFERWRGFHDLVGPAILLFAFAHSWLIGMDLENVPLRALWIVLLGLGASVFVYHRLLRPRLLSRKPYEVTDVSREGAKVWTVKLAPPRGGRIFDYVPGQFHFVKFLRGRGLPEEEHHWTIASSPAQREFLSSTIKELGDFTATIGETRPGDRAAVHGPFGRFSYLFHQGEKDLVFIAGGIGITPVMAMLRHMRDTGSAIRVTLLYGNPDRGSIVFHDELGEIERGGHPALKVVHVLERPGEGWTGESGYIDREKIVKYCGQDLSGKAFYIVGPPVLIEKTVGNLRGLGVPDAWIRLEIFSFLD
jgi:predicted ferric reductase